jgi:hypothetical protein
MNDTQTVFTVFFAIFWGVVANAWPSVSHFNGRLPSVILQFVGALVYLLWCATFAPVDFFVLVLKSLAIG